MKLKSLNKQLRLNRKGILGMELGKAFILGIFVMGVIGFAILIAMSQLNASSASTTATTNVFNNVSAGTEDFFSNAGTWFSLLAVVVLILIIAVVIAVVNKFGGGSRGGI